MVDLARKRIPTIIAGLVARDSLFKANRKIVGAVVDALVEATHREKTAEALSEKNAQVHISQQAVLDFTYDFYPTEAAPSPMPEGVGAEGE